MLNNCIIEKEKEGWALDIIGDGDSFCVYTRILYIILFIRTLVMCF